MYIYGANGKFEFLNLLNITKSGSISAGLLFSFISSYKLSYLITVYMALDLPFIFMVTNLKFKILTDNKMSKKYLDLLCQVFPTYV